MEVVKLSSEALDYTRISVAHLMFSEPVVEPKVPVKEKKVKKKSEDAATKAKVLKRHREEAESHTKVAYVFNLTSL